MTRINHDEVRDILPEYRSGSLETGKNREIEDHLRGCHDCRQALSGIEALAVAEVPDPGDAFWLALPHRVRTAAAERPAPRFSFRLLFGWRTPAAAAALLALLVFALWPQGRRNGWDPFFHDPLSATVLEYHRLTEKDVPSLIEPGEGKAVFAGQEYLNGYSYLREMASLSAEELKGLAEALERQQQKGGAS